MLPKPIFSTSAQRKGKMQQDFSYKPKAFRLVYMNFLQISHLVSDSRNAVDHHSGLAACFLGLECNLNFYLPLLFGLMCVKSWNRIFLAESRDSMRNYKKAERARREDGMEEVFILQPNFDFVKP